MARERLKDFLRSRGGGDSLNYVIDDGGDRSYDPGLDDLGVDNVSGKELRPLIRDYLAYLTVDNDFPIAPGGQEIVLTTPEGDPSPLEAAESTGATRVFVESNSLQEYSDSGKLTQFVGPTGFVDKTRGQGGNELLPGVQGTGLDATGGTYVPTAQGDRVPTVVGSMLRKENKYTPEEGEQFVPRNTSASTLDQRVLAIPDELGKYSTTGNTVTFDELRKIGTSLLLKASRIDSSDTPRDSVRVDTATTLSGEALSPADVFSASSRVDTRLFDPTRADGSSQALVGRNASLFASDSGEGQQSYGTMNSPITPFNGPLPAGMIAQAALGIAALGSITAVAGVIFSLIPGGRRENPARAPFLGGRNDVPSTAGALAEMVGITPAKIGIISTRNAYQDCVKAGVLTFFGAGGGGLSSVTGLASSILESPGYYVVLIRSILRSVVQFEEALKGFNSSGLSLQNLSAAVTFIDTIRRSRLIGYLNALAAIGDAVLTNSSTGFLSLESFGVVSSPSLDPTYPANRVMLSREADSPTAGIGALGSDYRSIYTGPSGRLAWRMGSAPASYLIPKTIFEGEKGLTPTENAVMKTNIINKSMLSRTGRLPTEIVQDIEALLDAEYVPFYMHDLRTNEIIGFHAFLDSLDDSFAVNATTEQAFGRLDGVKIYGGTTRAISFGFVIAATSEEDFDEMWFRINKLVTLVYPQWTSGDEVTGETRDGTWNPKYKVPFSQVVGASPLIRVRIGDVISSNYSRFGLSRFFGATDRETVLSDPSGPNKRGQNARQTRFNDTDTQGKKSDARYYPPGSKSTRELSKIEEYADTLPVIVKPSMGNSYTLVEAAGLLVRPIKTYFPIRGKINTVNLAKFLTEQKATDTFKGLAKDAMPMAYIDVTVDDDRYAGDIDGKTIKVTKADFMIDPDRGPGVISVPGLDFSPVVEETGLAARTTSFFDPANNAVVRAFETTRGKGLAGMITSLKFNWLDQNNTWEVTRGSRAPMWCKVSVSMDVIHDLPLGMSHDGFMIAPTYPVGNVNRKFFGTQYTTPNEDYGVPIAPGNDDLVRVTKDPKVLNNSAVPGSEAINTATGG
jgi:hypothetical protein